MTFPRFAAPADPLEGWAWHATVLAVRAEVAQLRLALLACRSHLALLGHTGGRPVSVSRFPERGDPAYA